MAEVHPESSQGSGESARQEPISGRARGPVVKFASFELRTDTRELSKQGIRVKLQIKPFQVLETLLERPGELVTRDELRHKLWASGTFVDFESGLNTAINRLRAALGDSAEEPRYIETLPRLGYRFICPVQRPKDLFAVPSIPAPSLVVPSTVDATVLPVVVRSLKASPAVPPTPSAPFAHSSRTAALWIAAGCLISGVLLFVVFHSLPAHHSPPDFRAVTLRGGTLINARFVSGSKVIYSARSNDLRQTFVANLDGTESRELPVGGVLAAASARGDLAIVSRDASGRNHHLRLTRSSISGGPSGTLAENVAIADWSPDGKQLALIRDIGSEWVLEFPAGHVLYRSQSWIDSVRVSRDGKDIAFFEHPARDDDGGHVRIVNAAGQTRVLTIDWSSAEGLAWSPSGRDIWFTASTGGVSRSLYTVSRSGKVRKISDQPPSLRLLDVAESGRVLMAVDDNRMVLRTAVSGGEAEISQFDFSHIDDITPDGKELLFTESGDGGGLHYSAYVYDCGTRAARRIGSGRALALSPDDSEALTVDPQDRTALTLTSLRTGQAVKVPSSGFRYQWAKFFGSGELLVGGSYPGQPLMLASENILTGSITPLTDAPYLDSVAISPDGAKIAGSVNEVTEIIDLATKTIHRLPSEEHSMPVVWSADGKSLFLLASHSSSYSIVEYSVATERTNSWKKIVPQDAATFMGLSGVAAAPKSGSYAYSASLKLSRLYVVDGLS